MVRVESDQPFTAYWPNRSHIDSQPEDKPFNGYFAGDGEIEWYAKVVAGAMLTADERSYAMQTYTRRSDGKPGSEMYPNEPLRFPTAVVDSMRRKFGADANEWLAKLRWNRDHWFFIKDCTYHGVEPDGHIHT